MGALLKHDTAAADGTDAAMVSRRDLDTVRRMASGDPAAMGELYDRHARAVYSLSCRIISDAADAEDVVQEVFSQAWRQANRYDAERATVAGWLLMMTRTRSIDRLRARQVRPAVSGDVEAKMLLQRDPSPDPEAEAVTTDAVARMRAAFAALSEGQRRAIELAYFDGLTQADIAEQLREPLGTVKTRIRSGLLRLRAAMGRESL
ncbi:MAG: sigma-70 family RNA polymerase sigma factor [Acidobacteriota bacterium]